MTYFESELAVFHKNNPHADIKCDDDGRCRINEPWGDKSLAIFVPFDGDDDEEDAKEEREKLFEALNSVILPEEFSGFFHVETEQLEILWTAYEIKASAKGTRKRSFNVVWKGVSRRCAFEVASSSVLCIAKHCFPVSNSGSTAHRNIMSFNLYAHGADHPMLAEPVCFKIDCSGLNDAERLEFVRHLNSYMIYFDRKTPRVLIHSPVEKKFKENPPLPEGVFPELISARALDSNLVSYWTEAFSTSDLLLRYLMLYRIIEYASFNYLDGEIVQEIKRELSSPSLLNNIDGTARRVASAFIKSKEVDPIPRVQNMIVATVDMAKLWASIEVNLDHFKKDFEFDGGYEVKALLSGRCDFETWKPNGVRTTFDRLRMLRNALAHGQDGSTRGTIRPTRQNSDALVPWINILETIAADAMFLQEHV